MKMINCDVILDILPLYIDGAVSEDTKRLVETHLQECEMCRQEAEMMGKSVVLPDDLTLFSEEVEVLEKSVYGLEKRVRGKIMTIAAAFDLLFNVAMPFFVRRIQNNYIKVQSMQDYEGLEGVMSREMLNTQWDFAAVFGYCLFFGAADIFYIIGNIRKKNVKISEPLVVLSYALKAAALFAFIITEIF